MATTAAVYFIAKFKFVLTPLLRILPRPAVNCPEFVLCRLQALALLRGEMPAGSIDIKRQHRHRRVEWRRLAASAAVRGTLQRKRDVARVLQCEHAGFEIQRITALRHPLRPAPGASALPGLSLCSWHALPPLQAGGLVLSEPASGARSLLRAGKSSQRHSSLCPWITGGSSEKLLLHMITAASRPW